MLNRIGFVPKKATPQLHYYKNLAGSWCAVFISDADREYHIQLNTEPMQDWK
jgi:hypothetical protein